MNTIEIFSKRLNQIKVKMINTLHLYCKQTKHFPFGVITRFFLFLFRWMSESAHVDRPPLMGLANLTGALSCQGITHLPSHDRTQKEIRRTEDGPGCSPEVRCP